MSIVRHSKIIFKRTSDSEVQFAFQFVYTEVINHAH